jgi:DNA-binding transcriptional LysR family regulator
MDWNELRIFTTVAELCSFTRAGRTLNLSQSAVSRHIGALEGELKVALFRRHPTGIVLTEAGQELHRAVQEMNQNLSIGLARINEIQERPEGPLRITTSVTFGSAWLSSRMNLFRSHYPEIAVSLLLVDNAELDLLKGEADVAIRYVQQSQPNLVQLPLMTINYHVFASKEYLNKRGTPKIARELDQHDIIVYGEDVAAPVRDMNWLLEVDTKPGHPRHPALTVNSVYGIFRAVKSGLGIAALPYYLSEEDANLVEIFPELEGPAIKAYYVYPMELKHSRRIVALRDFLLEQVAEYQRNYINRRRGGRRDER